MRSRRPISVRYSRCRGRKSPNREIAIEIHLHHPRRRPRGQFSRNCQEPEAQRSEGADFRTELPIASPFPSRGFVRWVRSAGSHPHGIHREIGFIWSRWIPPQASSTARSSARTRRRVHPHADRPNPNVTALDLKRSVRWVRSAHPPRDRSGWKIGFVSSWRTDHWVRSAHGAVDLRGQDVRIGLNRSASNYQRADKIIGSRASAVRAIRCRRATRPYCRAGGPGCRSSILEVYPSACVILCGR